MPVSWNYYLRLRKTTTEGYIAANKITSYQQLLSGINRRDVEPPLEEEVKEFLTALSTPSKPVKSSTAKASDPARSKAVKEKTQKTDISKRKPRRTRSKSATTKK